MWQAEQLTYCSNLHAGECLDAILANIERYFAAVKTARGLTTMHSGLWLSAEAAKELQSPSTLARFQQSLTDNGVLLTSLNGFPYGNFHQESVKTSVYLPDWSDPKRLHYTQQLAEILAACLPSSSPTGVISSLPLGYQHGWSPAKQQAAIQHLLALNGFLDNLFQRTGKQILVCLEMEPDCVLESTSQLIQFFTVLRLTNGRAPAYLGACFDVCHQAVMYENCYDSLQRITQAGIAIGKIQLSNAIHVDVRALQAPQSNLRQVLHTFAEGRYLHQVKGQTRSKQVLSCDDLISALVPSDRANNIPSKSTPSNNGLFSNHVSLNPLQDTESWRIHFHIPLNTEHLTHPSLSPLHSELMSVIEFLTHHQPSTPHLPCLEVETYSWNVLPKALQPNNDDELIRGIVQEIQWLEQQLAYQGLLVTQSDSHSTRATQGMRPCLTR